MEAHKQVERVLRQCLKSANLPIAMVSLANIRLERKVKPPPRPAANLLSMRTSPALYQGFIVTPAQQTTARQNARSKQSCRNPPSANAHPKSARLNGICTAKVQMFKACAYCCSDPLLRMICPSIELLGACSVFPLTAEANDRQMILASAPKSGETPGQEGAMSQWEFSTSEA